MKLSDIDKPPIIAGPAPPIFTLIVGLAPAYECQPNQHCMGAFMRTLCALSGLQYHEYLERFGRLNLFSHPIEKFVMPPKSAALEEAHKLLAKILLYFKRENRATRRSVDLPSLRILCAGTIAHEAMRQALVDMRHLIPICFHVDIGFIPHPSGRNRMLNNPEIRIQVGRTLRAAAEESTSTPNDFYNFIYGPIASRLTSAHFVSPINSQPIFSPSTDRSMADGHK
jgi:hypothetical protein